MYVGCGLLSSKLCPMNVHWIFEVDSKFSPLWMEWLPSPSILCPFLHHFTSQLCTSCYVLDLEGYDPSTRLDLVQRYEQTPLADFWVLPHTPDSFIFCSPKLWTLLVDSGFCSGDISRAHGGGGQRLLTPQALSAKYSACSLRGLAGFDGGG